MLSLRQLLVVAFLGIFFVLAQDTPGTNVPAQTTVAAPPENTEGTISEPEPTDAEDPSPTDVVETVVTGGGEETGSEDIPSATDVQETAPPPTDVAEPTQTEGPSAPGSNDLIPPQSTMQGTEVEQPQSTNEVPAPSDVEGPASTDEVAPTEVEGLTSTDVGAPQGTEVDVASTDEVPLPTEVEEPLSTEAEAPPGTEVEEPQSTNEVLPTEVDGPVSTEIEAPQGTEVEEPSSTNEVPASTRAAEGGPSSQAEAPQSTNVDVQSTDVEGPATTDAEAPETSEVEEPPETDVEAPQSTEVDEPQTTKDFEAPMTTDFDEPPPADTTDAFSTDEEFPTETQDFAEPTTEAGEPEETDSAPSETGDDQPDETQSSNDDNDEPTETSDNDEPSETGSDDEPATTGASEASATDDDSPEATSSDKADNDNNDDDNDKDNNDDDDDSATATGGSGQSTKTGSNGASNTSGGSGAGGAGIVAVDADNGVESTKLTPADVTTPEQHEVEAKANLPYSVISGDDAQEVVVMEAIMFDHFVQKDPAPVDSGVIEISSNVSSCQVGVKKRSMFTNRAVERLMGRELRDNCTFVTRLEFDVHFNYIRSASDGERPNKLTARVKSGVDYLNDAYGELGLTFNYKAYQQWSPPVSGDNKDWSKIKQNSKRLESWLTQTRTGNEMTLNVWLVNDLRSDDGDKELNGYSSYPWDKKGTLDGIVLREDRLSEDSVPTFIHEVGHWLGLRHTFREQVEKVEDDCKPADTLIDTSITTGVKASMYDCSQTTCSDSNKDVINFMSYSQCRGKTPKNGFSTDQKSSIFARVIKYRRGYKDGECGPALSSSTSSTKMMKRSTMQDLVEGSCPNVAAGVADLESQPTNTSGGARMSHGVGYVLVVIAGCAMFMI